MDTPGPPRRMVNALWAVLALALVGGGTAVLRAVGESSHPLGVACGECHLAGAATTAENAKTLTGSQEALCGRCHEGARRLSHPIGFHPKRAVPSDFPLDWKGDLTCSTCHAVHAEERERLRVASRGRTFCQRCHQEDFFKAMADRGESLFASGHLYALPGPLPEGLDPYTVHCLGCHDEQGDPGGFVQVDSGSVVRHSSGRASHPVGVPYPGPESGGRYHPRALLPSTITLPEGKVSCVSCHEGYSATHGGLVMSNERSRLCFTCHDL